MLLPAVSHWFIKINFWLHSVRMCQPTALIKALPRISPRSCTNKMHQRPNLWHTQRASSLSTPHGWPTPVACLYMKSLLQRLGHRVVTKDSCSLCKSNGSLVCSFAGGVTAVVHNEGSDILIPLRWGTRIKRTKRKLKNHPWEWLQEIYRNLVILVVFVMAGVFNPIITSLRACQLKMID